MSAVGGKYMARELGAWGFLAKPVDLDSLEATLDGMLSAA
jgi:hypothetical protein